MDNNKRLKKRSGHPFFFRLFFTMIVITILQLFIFLSVLLLGGEFSYIKRYAYNVFTEKNANRKNYVESTLTQKTSAVNSSAGDISSAIDNILSERGMNAEDLKSDKSLNVEIISESSEMLLSLLRQSQVNDVFMILDSGELYGSGSKKKMSGFYIRDIDPRENNITNNEDLLMEMGNSNVASSLGIVLDFEWVAQLDPESCSDKMNFYYTTVDTAANSNSSKTYELGYWSGFSRISRSADESMKYTVPLISKDNEIYGVIGIGITKKLFQDIILTKDSSDQSCCILGSDMDNDGQFDVQMYYGTSYPRLEQNKLSINTKHRIEGDIYDFTYNSDIQTIGNIQKMNLYNSSSPYKTQRWALISISEQKEAMAIYNELVEMFLTASLISMGVCIVGAVIINGRITAPVTKMIKVLKKSSAESGDIVKFTPSHINEIDTLGDAITRLQINVRENASRVSKIIGMVDIGIGVFMYNCRKNYVFLSESLVKLLRITELPWGEDVTISFEKFKEYLNVIDKDGILCSNKMFCGNIEPEDAVNSSVEINYPNEDGSEKWLKFSLTLDNSNVLGLVQDITASVIEKRRIEFERDYDVTTGLLNRRAYLHRLDTLFSQPEKLKTAAIIMMDLDNLKYVNDTYGHDFGDNYIKAAANVFNEFSNYNGTVARLSGDEFNVFLYGYNSKDEIRRVIDRVLQKLSQSYCLLSDGTKYKIRASGGIAWYPENSQSYDTLMKYADFAMYTIKHTVKGKIVEFDENEYKKDNILITGIEEMNRIFEEECVRFAFQAIVSAKTGKVFGYEMLMRPQSDILKYPLEFIRIAKSSSKLYEIERLTWMKGLHEFSEKIEKNLIAPDAKVFINSIANCCISDECISCIENEYKDILKNIVVELLEIESENESYTGSKFEMVKKWNAAIALDDFGTGYNSEYLFIKLSPDLIKIDRSIVSGCDNDATKTSIIGNLVQMAKEKNTLVLAEGVETSGELKRVVECGVDLIQGYYITRPVFDPKPIKKEITEEILRINRDI